MSDRLPIFYTFRRCPYAMRARMAIKTAEISVEQIEVSLKNKPQGLLDCSPKATVPVVVLPDGEVIEQSRDIMLWALKKSDPCNWLFKENELKQQEMMRLVDKCDLEFKPLLDRYKYFDRHPEFSQEEYRRRAEVFLTELDRNLSTHAFLIDEHMRFADVAIFPFIRQFAAVDADWFKHTAYKNVQYWLDYCVNTQLFKKVMEKPGG
jgi:glutathione S-transferase